MKEQAIQKINKVGKVSYIITVICKILVIAGLVCSVVGAIMSLTQPEDSMSVTQRTTMTVEMSQDGVGSGISGEELEEMKQSMDDGAQLRISQVNNGVAGSDLQLFSTEQNYTPVAVDMTDGKVTMEMISDEVSFTLRQMGVLMLLMAAVLVVTIVTLTFVEGLCKAFRDCESPFEENVIKKMQRLAKALIPWMFVSSMGESVINSMTSGGVRLSLSIDLGVVLVVAVVLILVYVFKYGAVLQQESDETL